MHFSISDIEIKDYFPGLKYSNLLKTLLFVRGISEKDAADFLHAENLPLESSSKIFGITKAAKIINEAIEKNKKIIIHGDFDVDGVCSVTILFDYLYFERKADVLPIIPNRADEGYGLSEKTINKALEAGGNLVITVDCGIKDYDLVEKYKKKIDFIITDHHQFREDENGEILLPKAKAVVHSVHPKSKYPTMISGAATTWQLAREIEKCHCEEANFASQNSPTKQSKSRHEEKIASASPRNDINVSILSSRTSEQSERDPGSDSSLLPKISTDTKNQILNKFSTSSQIFQDDKSNLINSYLDLVALSTICDIIPLTLENRKLVQKGIKQIAKTERLGLQKLAEITGIDLDKIESYHFGFVLGPRLNAPGRILNDAMDSVRLLTTRKEEQAIELAAKLHQLNFKRQDITKDYLEQAEKQIDEKKLAIVVLGEEWPEGILGLVAGRLSEKYNKPTFVASVNKDGEITGSSRSKLEDLYLVKVLESAKSCLTRFGGHKSAAGFASTKELFKNFETEVLKFLEKNTKPEDFKKTIKVDLKIEDFDLITMEAIEELKLLEPHGANNEKPVFLFPKVKIKSKRLFGKDQNHLILEFEKNGKTLTGKQFNFDQNQIIELGQELDLIGGLGINEWNGRRTIEIDIKFIT